MDRSLSYFPRTVEDVFDPDIGGVGDKHYATKMYDAIWTVVADLHRQAHVNQSLDIRHCYLSPCRDL